MSPTDIVKLVRELGYYWGPPVAALCILGGAIYVRWKQRYRKLYALLCNWLVFSATAACLAGLPLFYRYYGVPAAFAASEVGILVAEVPGDNRREQQNAYAQAIRGLVADTPDLADVVKVRLLTRPLPDDADQQHKVASSIGRRLHAALVLRVIPVSGGYESWLTIVDQPEFARRESHGEKLSQTQIQEIEKLPLPKDVALLARCAVALSFYSREQYQQAAEHLVKILEASELPSAAPPRSYLSFVLGNSLWSLGVLEPAPALPLAIQAYDKALRDWNRENNPAGWAATMNNRGGAYADLPGPDRAANFTEAVRSFDRALQVYTHDRYPLEWAMTMYNRGNAYSALTGPDRAANLAEAIRCFDQALQVYTRDRHAIEWAMAMNNRGVAYAQLAGADRVANLQEAIGCFDQALQVLTRDRHVTAWATTMNNRGNAYAQLPGPDRTGNLQEAIRCYDQALQVYTRERYPIDWAMTMQNRGAAYAQLPGPDRAANLQEAIRCFDHVLQVRTRDRYPTIWAWAVNNRGSAYALLPGPDRSANLQEAIRCWREALGVYESQGSIDDAAEIRRNLERGQKELAALAAKR